MVTMLLAFVCAAGLAGGVLLMVAGLRGHDPAAPAERPVRRPGRALLAMVTGPLLGLRIGAAAAAGVLIMAAVRWPVAAAAAAGLILMWPSLFGSKRQVRDKITQLEAIAMWTESLKDLTAGATGLPEAIPLSIQLAHPSLAGPLTRLEGRLTARDHLAEALDPLGPDLNDPSADEVIAALRLNATARGPGLSAMLQRQSTLMREELELRQRIEATRRGDRRTVQIIVAMVVLMLTAMALVLPPEFRSAYRGLTGQLVLAAVFALFAVVFAWMRRLHDPDAGESFLMDPDRSVTRPLLAEDVHPDAGRPRTAGSPAVRAGEGIRA